MNSGKKNLGKSSKNTTRKVCKDFKLFVFKLKNWKIVKKETKQIEEIVGGTQDAKEILNLPSEDVDEDQNKVDQVSWVRSY